MVEWEQPSQGAKRRRPSLPVHFSGTGHNALSKDKKTTTSENKTNKQTNTENVTSTMFADDTTILVRGPSVTSLSTQLNEVARTVSTWADNNRMSLNTTKLNLYLLRPCKNAVL